MKMSRFKQAAIRIRNRKILEANPGGSMRREVPEGTKAGDVIRKGALLDAFGPVYVITADQDRGDDGQAACTVAPAEFPISSRSRN